MTIKKRRVWFSIGFVAVVMLILQIQPVDRYISVMKNRQAITADGHMDERERLRLLIEQWKEGKEEKPIDATLDRIWKAIPGYNGRMVDEEASLNRMLQSGTPSPEMLIYKEVPPAVTLDQLGAQPIYRGNPKKPAVSFMINVAWGNEYLDSILNTLDKHKVKTTFFLDGSWVKRYPEEAKKIAARGHEIGNHAYSHPDMKTLGTERIHQEIGRTQEMITKTLGITPKLFAPPSGSFTERVVQIANSPFQMKTILWTADTLDWKKPEASTVIRRIAPKLENGTLVLMHPTAATQASLDQLLTMAKQKGLVPTTVSEVISSSRLP